jgi:hypothetical protein
MPSDYPSTVVFQGETTRTAITVSWACIIAALLGIIGYLAIARIFMLAPFGYYKRHEIVAELNRAGFTQ